MRTRSRQLEEAIVFLKGLIDSEEVEHYLKEEVTKGNIVNTMEEIERYLKEERMVTILKVGNYAVEKDYRGKLWLTNKNHGSSMLIIISYGRGYCVEDQLQEVLYTKMTEVLENKRLMYEALMISAEAFKKKYTLSGTKRRNYGH